MQVMDFSSWKKSCESHGSFSLLSLMNSLVTWPFSILWTKVLLCLCCCLIVMAFNLLCTHHVHPSVLLLEFQEGLAWLYEAKLFTLNIYT